MNNTTSPGRRGQAPSRPSGSPAVPAVLHVASRGSQDRSAPTDSMFATTNPARAKLAAAIPAVATIVMTVTFASSREMASTAVL